MSDDPAEPTASGFGRGLQLRACRGGRILHEETAKLFNVSGAGWAYVEVRRNDALRRLWRQSKMIIAELLWGWTIPAEESPLKSLVELPCLV